MGASSSTPTPELAAAEVRHIDAKTRYQEAKSAAISLRASADVNAATVLTAANAQHARAEAYLPWVLLGTSALIAAGLAVDVYLHESPTHIKRRMLSTLRKCRLPRLAPAPTNPLHVSQEPLVLDFLPTLLLGPSGCGKSTLLSGIVASLPRPTPVVLVRLRLPATRALAADKSAGTAQMLMDETAKQIFSQIGFPLRRSLIGGILAQGFTLQGERTQAELNTSQTSTRLVAALRILFEVCEELAVERRRTMSPLDAAPVLLFDEVQDLIKDARLKQAGGTAVLNMLGSLLVGYCVDRNAVRAVLAGSSSELYFAFAETTPLRDARWGYHDLQDPDLSATADALAARGYNAEEVRSMVDLCGTRLRLLQRPLTVGKARCSAAQFLSSARAMGTAAFTGIFSRLDKGEATQLAALLDSIEACDAASESSALHDQSAPAAPVRPSKAMLPDALLLVEISPILFVSRNSMLFFQSQLHRRVWQQQRSQYVK